MTAPAPKIAEATEKLRAIREKCEQYWNEDGIPMAEVHAILENIHRHAGIVLSALEARKQQVIAHDVAEAYRHADFDEMGPSRAWEVIAEKLNERLAAPGSVPEPASGVCCENGNFGEPHECLKQPGGPPPKAERPDLVPTKCPKCGGEVIHSGHGAYCPDRHCKWGWETGDPTARAECPDEYEERAREVVAPFAHIESGIEWVSNPEPDRLRAVIATELRRVAAEARHPALMAIGDWQTNCPCTCARCDDLRAFYSAALESAAKGERG